MFELLNNNDLFLDFNVLPVSIERIASNFYNEDLDRITALKEEIEIQKELLGAVDFDSPEYEEIEANLIEATSELQKTFDLSI